MNGLQESQKSDVVLNANPPIGTKIRRSRNQGEFYVYVYLDPRKSGKFVYGEYEFDYEPFYVGAGSGRRHNSTFFDKAARGKLVLNRNEEIKQTHNKLPLSKKIIFNLTREESFIKERELILLIGRFDKGKGTLLNQTDGGLGIKGYAHSEDTKLNKIPKKGKNNPFYGKKHSEEAIIKMSKPRKNPCIGHPISEETKEKLRQFNLGKKVSEETRRKISDSHKARVKRKKKEDI